jgi:nucleotide-binding universal stress UspA family protein
MKFLVAIDGSQISQKVIQTVLSLATPTKAVVILLNVVEPVANYYPKMMMPTGDWVTWQGLPDVEFEKNLLNSSQVLLDDAAKAFQAAGMECLTRMEIGSPRDTICAIAKEESVDFLVVGSRGLGTVERLMLGSVSDYVAHHSNAAVIIVR